MGEAAPTDPAITRIWPLPSAVAARDEDLLAWYAAPDTVSPWTRVNFVSSADGAATHGGLSGGLSDAADRRVFDLLRVLCDVVVVGAGTVRAEGYGPMRLPPAAQERRREVGRAAHPVFALVSASLALDARSPIFTDAPVRPIVVSAASAPPERRTALAEVADVLVCGDTRVDTGVMVSALAERGLTRIHSEGGPHLFGAMLADDAVDELCLTVSARLEGSSGPGIVGGETPATSAQLHLAHVLVAGDTLLLRYLRHRGG